MEKIKTNRSGSTKPIAVLDEESVIASSPLPPWAWERNHIFAITKAIFFRIKNLSIEMVALTRELFLFAIRPQHSLLKLTENLSYSRRTYLYTYLFYSTLGLLSIIVYSAFGGHRYFNPRYLYLMPMVTALVGAALIAVSPVCIDWYWRRHGLKRGNLSFLRLMILPLMLTPLAWVFYPLKFIFMEWEFHAFYTALVIWVYFTQRILFDKKLPNYHARIIMGWVLYGGGYFSCFFYLPNISSELVRILRL